MADPGSDGPGPAVPARLNVVTLGVLDLPRMRDFYRALGRRTTSTGDDFAAFPLGGAVLALYSLEALAREAGLPTRQGDGFSGFTCAVCVEREDEVDAAIAAVPQAGGRVLAEPVAREWGGRSGYFADPEANVWEVAWLPNGSFDERGGLIWPY